MEVQFGGLAMGVRCEGGGGLFIVFERVGSVFMHGEGVI